jgi:protein-disulfide isomerase
VGRPKQNLPRAFREPQNAQAAKQTASLSRGTLLARTAIAGALAATTILAALALLSHTGSQAVYETRTDHEVGVLLAGIPQEGSTLGRRTAPVTLEIFADLKDPDCRYWFAKYLPAILHDDVRTGVLKIEYHSFKTNTYYPAEFVKEQTTALAAGAQNKLWNFIDIFYHEQGTEFASYVTEGYLSNIARQVPGLNSTQLRIARSTGRREEQTTTEDQAARVLGLHVTPSFRIGRTAGKMKDFSGRTVIKFKTQHPIALIDAHDLARAIKELAPSS